MTNERNINSIELFQGYPDVITICDLQNMLHIGRNTAYKLLRDNAIGSIRVGKKYIIPKSSVANFVTEGMGKMNYTYSNADGIIRLDMTGCSNERSE